MFKMLMWLFDREKGNEVEKTDETEKVEKVKADNYETEENGDIKIRAEKRFSYTYGTFIDDTIIPKSSIVSHTKNSIVLKDYRYYYNFEHCLYSSNFKNVGGAIENKQNFIKYKETQLKTYEYLKENKYWKLIDIDVVATEVEYEKTPLEIFKEKFKSKYGLIETEDEFNEYISSSLDCDTWCRKKLYDKMKELGLGEGFINQFADLIGNDLNKYHAMIDLANEVSDKDTLMYLYTYKFSK